MTPFESLRFLEIGEVPVVKSTFPGQTEFFQVSPRRHGGQAGEAGSPIGMAGLLETLRGSAVDLIFCQSQTYSPWHPNAINRAVFNRRVLTSRLALHRPYGPQLLRFYRSTPLAVIDLSDAPYLERSKFHLLDRATVYFKRELPTDEWKLLTMTATPTQPSRRFRNRQRYVDGLAKVMPISLGFPLGAAVDLPTEPIAKTADIFFAGTVDGMPVRQRALKELMALRGEGFRIDIPTEKLSRADFYRRCAAAWTTLSPEGLGWDCFRHYEAGACGSIPLMNMPIIRRHAPFTDGVDAFFFAPEEGGLTATIRRAFSRREALPAFAAAAKQRVERHHTPEAIIRYVTDATLAAAQRMKRVGPGQE